MIFLLIVLSFWQQNSIELSVTVEKIEGRLFIAVYDEDDDYMEKASVYKVVKINRNQLSVSIPVENTGRYVIAVFQDLNGDEELSTTFMGIPKEPYGFSNNARGSFGPPSFELSSFLVKGKTSHSISLN